LGAPRALVEYWVMVVVKMAPSSLLFASPGL
jgi:hypothetical protein